MAAPQQMSGGTTSGSSRYKVGDATVTAVTDGFRTAPLADGFVLNASKEEVNKALEDGGLPRDQLTIVFNPVVIETAGKRVLIDAGMGIAASKAPNATFGFLVDNMKEAGIDPGSIDLVIISHFHGDHVNGLWAAPGELAFPNAEITVPEPEWKFWYDDGEMARAPKGRMQDLFASNRKVFDPIKDKVAKHSWEKEVVPGLTAIGTPGHSAGHTSYVLNSGADSVFILSDVTNRPELFVRNPGWHAMFDQDPAMAETSRRKTLDMLAAEKMPVQAFHFPMPGRATIEKKGNTYREVQID